MRTDIFERRMTLTTSSASISSFRSQKNSIRRPASSDSMAHACFSDIESLAKLDDASSNTIDSKDSIVTSVPSLLSSRRYPNVSGLIVSVVVNSFDSHAARHFTHVGTKMQVTVSPPGANLDAPASVIVKACVRWIGASSNHVAPNGIEFCRTVDEQNVVPEASTRGRVASPQSIISDNHKCSAFTQAAAGGISVPVAVDVVGPNADNSQSCESSTNRDRFFGRHSVGYFNVVFSSGRSASTGARCRHLSNDKRRRQ